MAISFTSVKCPECGASFEIESGRKMAFCTYCGTKIFLNNENEYIIHTIDEAEIKKAEARIKEAEVEHDIRMKEIEVSKDDSKKSQPLRALFFIIGLAFIAFSCVMMFFHPFGETNSNQNFIGTFLNSFGIIFLFVPLVLKESDRQAQKDAESRRAGLIKFPTELEAAKKMNYQALESMLISSGFYNIEVINLRDLWIKGSKKRGRIENVTISGDSPESSKWYKKSEPIVITYHGLSSE